jgi:hypothetical protein
MARHVHSMLAAEDPKFVVDDLERSAGLPSAASVADSLPAVLCARVIATVLERRMLARDAYRTTPGYLDGHCGVGAAGWVQALPDARDALRAAEATSRPDEFDASKAVGHLFAVHRGELPLSSPASSASSIVAFDFRDGMAHAIHANSKRVSSLALGETYARTGRLNPLVEWVELHL